MTTAPLPPVSSAQPGPDTRRDTVVVGIAIALLVTAVTISTFYSRADGDLDTSVFVLGALSALGLVGIAAAAGVLLKEPSYRAVLVGWPGAFGSIAVGSMLGVLLDDASATVWLIGLVILGLSVGGYLLCHEAALTLSGVVGLALLYGKFIDFVGLGDKIDADSGLMWFGAVVLVFTAAVTVASFFTPHRVLIGVSTGIATVVLYLGSIAVIAFLGAFFSGFDDEPAKDPLKELHNDIYVLLFFSVLLVAGWSYCAYRTSHPGYRLLGIGLTAGIVPASMAVLGAEHPSAWILVIGAIGGAVLAAVVVLMLQRQRAGGGPATMPPPPPPTYTPPSYGG